MAHCLFLIKYFGPVFIKTRTWIEESHMVLGATGYWPLVCHSSFHPSLCWLIAAVETPSQASLRTLEPDLDRVQMMQHDACMTMIHMMTCIQSIARDMKSNLKEDS
jgi:hypothetical protein